MTNPARIEGDVFEQTLARVIEKKMDQADEGVPRFTIARELANMAVDLNAKMVKALEWYRDASPAQRNRDNGDKARAALSGKT